MKDNHVIVVLTGLKRSGKDESAKALLETNLYTRYGFADPIKQACKEIFLFNEEQLEGSLKETVDERWGISPRRIFQLFGTELMREELARLDKGYEETVDESLWIKRFIEVYKQNPKNYVITDCRFPNELKMLRKNFENVLAIRIERDSVENNDMHASERQIKDLPVDFEIKNNGTLDELHFNIIECVETYLQFGVE